MPARRARRRPMQLASVALGLAAWSVVRDWERPWWRTDAVVTPAGAVFAGPRGDVLVVSDLPSGRGFTIVDPKGVVFSPNRPRYVTSWFVVPYSPAGVRVHPKNAKTEHDPCLKRDGARWSFIPLHSRVPIKIVGRPPFASFPPES